VLQEYLVSEEAGFRRSECDNAIFIKKEEDGSYTKMLVYIDDSLYYNTGEDLNIIKQLERSSENKFKVQFQGNAHWFLSMRITRDVHGNYLLDQSRHSKNLVKINQQIDHYPVNLQLQTKTDQKLIGKSYSEVQSTGLITLQL